ncbi:calcium/proton exchanger [Clostridium grantii]|uniref:Ca(2+)/H(+) antiporter n=1 Tax=Clostridium grantii DSM 8605 TaxID=1121316 RepID=A0A1M5RS98_9CLOT|nr:calcium/proton exchanger [Clostridium grantii]SHH29154.1 Ca2+:H+ antiporter [Clostridium grantii DSM 8605]
MKKYLLYIISILVVLFFSCNNYLISVIVFSIFIIPIAAVLGRGTSEIAEYIGEKLSGLLASTTGNMPELMMGIWAIKFGMLDLVKSSMIGSIICNLLLVLGIAIFGGGIKFKEQSFNKLIARTNFNMLFLAIVAFIVMAYMNNYSSLDYQNLCALSLKISVVLIVIYVMGLIFSLYTHRNLFGVSENNEEIATKLLGKKELKKRNIIIFNIIVCSLILFFISEKLTYNIKQLIQVYNLSEEFIGIILIPILGNVGENFSAIMCAYQNKINLSIEIAIGSSIQIALFVTPLLIIFAFFTGTNMSLVFNNFQIIMSLIALAISYYVFQDGKTYWLEGAILLSVYIILTMAYYYLA